MEFSSDKFGHNKLILLTDLVVFIVISLFVSISIYTVPLPTYVLQILPALAVIMLSLYLLSVFEISLKVSLSSLMSRTFVSVGLAVSILLIIIYLLGPGSGRYVYGRGVLLISMSAFSVYLLVSRYLLYRYLRRRKPFHDWVYIGNAERYRTLKEDIKHMRRYRVNHEPVTWLDDNLGAYPEIAIVVDSQEITDPALIKKLITAKFNGIHIFSLHQFYEYYLERIPLSDVQEDWFLSTAGFGYINDSIRQRIKKTVDICLVLFTLPITLLLLVLSAILIVLLDHHSPVYSQPRIGQHGRKFTIYKLRTMRNSTADHNDSSTWTTADDRRVTTLGGYLRRYRFDELPQLLNVLKGEMSIIGPRPEQPRYTSLLAERVPYYEVRHSVKPGISGWAQVRFSYGSSVDDARSKLEYDLYYIKNYSLLLDLSILFKTIYTIVSGSGR